MNILHLQLFAKEVFCLFKVHVMEPRFKDGESQHRQNLNIQFNSDHALKHYGKWYTIAAVGTWNTEFYIIFQWLWSLRNSKVETFSRTLVYMEVSGMVYVAQLELRSRDWTVVGLIPGWGGRKKSNQLMFLFHTDGVSPLSKQWGEKIALWWELKKKNYVAQPPKLKC